MNVRCQEFLFNFMGTIRWERIVIKGDMIYYLLWETIEPKAALPSCFCGGYNSPSDERKELPV